VASFPGGQINHINPILNVSSLHDSIDFYTRVVGLELYHTFGEPADFAIVGRDGQQIYLAERAQGQRGMREHLAANGAHLVDAEQSDTGEYQVQDPDGHTLRLFG
jgi:catechol 2,3-dioxygenase-like lactoylglutathione lyase family enzyme